MNVAAKSMAVFRAIFGTLPKKMPCPLPLAGARRISIIGIAFPTEAWRPGT
jgi:hypothetical protein